MVPTQDKLRGLWSFEVWAAAAAQVYVSYTSPFLAIKIAKNSGRVIILQEQIVLHF